METTMEFTREIVEALGAAFPDDEIEFLPRAQSNGKAMALAYIDARSVMRRLDAAVGPANWSFDFDLLSPDGKMVKGRLTVLGVTKCDAGEAATEDEILKSAVSDALKRCAVHFGIGRYLYYLPRVWAPFDSQKRRFTEPPRLDPAAVQHALAICGVSPSAARTNGTSRTPSGPRPELRVESGGETGGPGKSVWSAGTRTAERPPSVRETPAAAPESSGDRAAAKAAPAPAAPAPVGSMTCSGEDCGKPLTKGQHDVSVRAFGQPLCPACQKARARVG